MSEAATNAFAALTQGRLTIDASVPRYRYTTKEDNMSSHPTDFPGSVIDALREAVDSLKTRTP